MGFDAHGSYDVKELFPIRTFDKEDQALGWLASLGLKIN